jgi:hypothetical protein
MLSSAIVLSLLSQSAPVPECHTSGASQACGFHCRAELNQAKCSQTPEGFCENVEQHLVCWDPPEEVRLHGVPGVKASCQVKFREVVCGFTCATSETHLACTQTPWGVCSTRFDSVACWDPSPEVIHAVPPGELVGAKCVQTDDGVACGWDCKTSYQQVACAQSPRGKCVVNEGHIACFDPPLPPITHAPVMPKK